jgi:hypothetical protein
VLEGLYMSDIGLALMYTPRFLLHTYNGAEMWWWLLISFGVLWSLLLVNVLPDYVSLLETRLLLKMMREATTARICLLFLCDLVFTVGTAFCWNLALSAVVGESGQPSVMLDPRRAGLWMVYPAFLTSTWLWLYVASGFLLKAARRFDISLNWFNRTFDVEHQPLQSIGLVAATLCTLAYWGFAFSSRLLK